MKKPFYKSFLFYGCILGFLIIAAIIIPTMGRLSYPAPRAVDSSNLRQLGQASLIYANGHNDRFPEATDVWDYACALAEAGIINEGTFWQSSIDPATAHTARKKIDILLPARGDSPRELNPAFRAIKPSVAVALGKLNWNMPSTTPIIWTRGLQSDGTWAPHSPYGTAGGYIMFLGGNVAYYRNLYDDGGQLISRDGSKTANILEALPKGVSIGEYIPTPEENKVWSAEKRPLYNQSSRSSSKWISIPLLLVIWAPFLGISIYRYRKNKSGVFRIFVWPAIITLLLLMITPTVARCFI